MNPIRERTLQVMGLAPIGLLAWFYIYVIRQRSLLGYWPRPYHPDPKDAGFVLHHLTLTLGMTLIPSVTLVTTALILHRRSVDPGFRWVSALTLSVGAFVMFWVVVWMDPGQCFEWFWD